MTTRVRSRSRTLVIAKPDTTTVSGSGPVATVVVDLGGTYSVIFTVTAERDCPPTPITLDPASAEATQPDLSLAGVADEDEETLGGFLCVNDDDDNGNGTPDKDDVGPTGGEDDLVQLWITANGTLNGTLTLDGVNHGGHIALYFDPLGSNPVTLPKSWDLFGLPKSFSQLLYVEGTGPSATARDIELKLTFTGNGGPCEDVVKLTVIQVDLDVDSDNSNTGPDFAPQRDTNEDDIEDDSTKPGRIIWVNNNDDDRDNVADFGDGFNLDGMAASDDDANAAESGFVRVVFEIPTVFDLTNATLQITYSASDPGAAIISATPPGVLPTAGNLRIWTKNGNQSRSESVIPIGDYVGPGTYAPADLGLSVTMRTVDFWIEGIAPSGMSGADRILFELDPDGVGPASPCADAVRVTVSQLSILDNMMVLTDHVDIGHWGDDRGTNELSGYTVGLSGTAINGPGGTLIDVDPDRFTVSLRHHPGNTNPAVAEAFAVQVATLTDAGAVDDADHNITLLETGPDTGVFLSESQLLTAPDLSMVAAGDQDDGLAVYSARASASVADEADNDRTHKATIDGYVRVTYTGLGGNNDITVPVCDRVPTDHRREVRIRVHVFNEPFDDFGTDGIPGTGDAGEGNGVYDVGEPYTPISPDGARNTVLGSTSNAMDHVAAQIGRANQAWALACIKVAQVGNILYEDAPVDSTGTSVLRDGDFDVLGLATDDRVVIAAATGITYDVLEVYFAGPIATSLGPLNAAALPPLVNDPPFSIPVGENSFTSIGVSLTTGTPLDARLRTLAHELG